MKEVLVGKDTITLRHSIPIPESGPGVKRIAGYAISCHGIIAEPRLSFAFEESFLGFSRMPGAFAASAAGIPSENAKALGIPSLQMSIKDRSK